MDVDRQASPSAQLTGGGPQRNFLVYKSSAGSGKTYTLVKEYLKIVLREPAAVQQILAITFTNAAAAEMKERIISALSQIASLAAGDENPEAKALISSILKEWEKESLPPLPEQQVVERAAAVLKIILHRYSDFSVSTIDSFVHRVIRTFAFDLRLPMNFDVELDAGALLNKAVDILISRVGRQPQLTRVMVAYMINQADDDKDIRLENQIAAMATTLMEEDSTGYIEMLKATPLANFLHIASTIRNSVRRFEGEVTGEAVSALALIGQHNIPMSAFYQGSRGIPGYFEQLAAGRVKDKLDPGKNVLATIDKDKWVSGKASAHDKEAIVRIKPLLTASFERIRALAAEGREEYLSSLAVYANIYPMAVLGEVEKVLEEIKSEHVLLHISDFNKKISDVVTSQPVPFIYERLGERYRHYMIDEFQDTSALQWQNLLPLLENGLAGGHLSLVVGDGKQAIYRFRNGDVEQFARLPGLTSGLLAVARPEWEVTLINNYLEKPLDTNWRSDREIVGFNNRFFSHAISRLSPALQTIYSGVAQQVCPGKEAGYAEISFMEASEGNSLKEATLDKVLETIARCHQAGHPYSDITILCRASADASLVARTLLGKQLPVISPESLLLSQSAEVNFFIAIIRLLARPTDAIAGVEMMNYLLASGRLSGTSGLHHLLKESGLFRPGRQPGNATLWPGLEKALAAHGIDFSFERFFHRNLYDTCELILESFFGEESPPNPFVAFFMDAIYDYSRRNTLTYNDFLTWWEENASKYSLVIPEGIDAIQVMTVHKSKGLQFPVVIHPFASQRADRPTKKGLWTELKLAAVPSLKAAWLPMGKKLLAGTPWEEDYQEEMEKTFLDMLNITYVAFTRASKKLFVLSKNEQDFGGDTVQGMLQAFLADEGEWRDDCLLYSFGRFEPPSAGKSPPKAPPSPYRQLLSSPWSHALRMRSQQAERSLLTPEGDPLERGNLLHRVMEKIVNVDEIEPVLQAMQERGEIDAVRKSGWQQKIQQMISHPDIAPCYAPGADIRTEPFIFDGQGNSYRPDRVALLSDRTVVIDYKTGRQYRKHEEQMDIYARLLEGMGYPSVEKILLYLDQGLAKSV